MKQKISSNHWSNYIAIVIVATITLGLMAYIISSNDILLNNLKRVFNIPIHSQNSEKMAVIDKPDIQKPIVVVCQKNSCGINFHDFVLANTPKDFNEIIEKFGISDGTKVLSGMLLQISDQLEQQSNGADADKIKQLAQIANNIALVQESIESTISYCSGSEICLSDLSEKPMTIPEGFKVSASAFKAGTILQQINYLGNAYSNTAYNQNLDHYTTKFLSNYQKLMKNNKLSPVEKAVITELVWDIAVISEEFTEICKTLFVNDPPVLNYIDPITGKEHNNIVNADNRFAIYINYNASSINDLNNSLVCAAKGTKKVGESCL